MFLFNDIGYCLQLVFIQLLKLSSYRYLVFRSYSSKTSELIRANNHVSQWNVRARVCVMRGVTTREVVDVVVAIRRDE